MSRLSRILLVFVIVVFVLACNFVTQPFQDAQNLAETAQSVATLIPVETLQSIPSVLPTIIPMETLEALPSAMPTVEALATDFGNSLDPQGTPVQEWRGIPIMPQAIAGQEFSETDTYSFRVNATPQDVQAFYNAELASRGWNQPLEMPVEAEGGFLFYDKENSFLSIFITADGDSVVVLLTLS